MHLECSDNSVAFAAVMCGGDPALDCVSMQLIPAPVHQYSAVYS